MPEFFENNEMEERVILVGVSSQDGDDTEDSLDELEELVKTAGAVTVGNPEPSDNTSGALYW